MLWVSCGVRISIGLGGGFDFGHGLTRGGMSKPFRQNDEEDWWRFSTVDVGETSLKFSKPLQAEKKKKMSPISQENN